MEACGICGSDIDAYEGAWGRADYYPLIRGHEPVGIIEEIGEEAGRRRRLRVGDRVAVDPFVPCGACTSCIEGNYEMCTGWSGRSRLYGSVSMSEPPGLWGGFASHLYVHPNTILYPVPTHIGPELATLYNPLGAGISCGRDACRHDDRHQRACPGLRPARPLLCTGRTGRRCERSRRHGTGQRPTQAGSGTRARCRCSH
jgi:threonine dehydrogenase-like Zn-dependent dehydrogenase